MRYRSQSNPNPRVSRPPYTYTPLSSPRHIRLIRILGYNPTLGQVFITLTEHPVEAVTNKFTALSYTWAEPVEEWELKGGPIDRTTPSTHPATPDPDTIELVILPPSSLSTFKPRDDLAVTSHHRAGPFAKPGGASFLLPRRSNLSDFFHAYLAGFPERHMRTREKHDGTTHAYSFEQVSHLWIDAVCIDQSNTTQEKATQIPLMGEIYSRAGRVLAWLGADPSRLATVFWLHEVAYPALIRFVSRAGLSRQGRWRGIEALRRGNCMSGRFWREVVGLEERPPRDGGNWVTAWVDFLLFYHTRRYFRRVWIVQEVVLAKRFDVMAGRYGRELGWIDMMVFIRLLQDAGWQRTLVDLARTALPAERGLPEKTLFMSDGWFGMEDLGTLQLSLQRTPSDEQAWPQKWLEALCVVRRRGCILQQDKVYATLGILQQTLPKGVSMPFSVDATASPEEVYIHAATALVLPMRDLALLSYVEHPDHRQLARLPSWVPDLSGPIEPYILGNFHTPFSACIVPSSSTGSSLRTVSPAGELRLRGFKLDTVSTMATFYWFLDMRLGEAALQLLASIPPLYPHKRISETTGPNLDPSITPSGQHRAAALVHVLTAAKAGNLIGKGPDETARLCAEFSGWLHRCFVQIYAKCLENGEQLDEARNLWMAIETSIAWLIAQEGEDGPTVAMVPRLDEVVSDAEAFVRAQRGEGPVPDCMADAESVFNFLLSMVMPFRTIFKTEDGWIGICAETCKEGDEVWLLQGGTVPYVLRKEDTGSESGGGEGEQGSHKYRFCGECYVHGVMEGELVKGKEDSIEQRFTEVVLV